MNDTAVSLVRCNTYIVDSVISALRTLLQPWGGMRHFVNPGERVLLKPNMISALSAEKAATTHPSVVGAVAALVKEAGGKPFYGDSPGFYAPEQVAVTAGFDTLGIRMGNFNDSYDVSFPEGFIRKRFTLAAAYREADRIINLPKLKTHGQMLMTCGVKNLFGLVQGMRKAQMHFSMHKKSDFALMLLDLYRYMRPSVTIVDAIIAMEGNGPGSGGLPRKLGFLAASPDAVALDTVCADIIGIVPHMIPYLNAAQERNIGTNRLEHITICGVPAVELKQKDFKLPRVYNDMKFKIGIPDWFLKMFLSPRPVIDHKKCKKCYQCVEICPAHPKSLTVVKERSPVFNYNTCIRCFCCQELCPYGAITIKNPLIPL